MNENRDFSLLLTHPERWDPMALAKTWAAIRHTPVQDQIIEAKRSWGIVADHLGEPEARSLSEQLKAGGFENVVVPAMSLVTLPEAKAVKHFEPGWADHLVLIAAAGMNITSTTTHIEHQGPTAGQQMLSAGIMLTTGLPIRIGPKKSDIKKEQTNTDLIFYVDLLYRDPLRRLRIDAQNFNYSFLQERRLYQVMGNFKLLLETASKLSPQAWRNQGTKILLEGLPVNTMGYTSLADLERETRWLLTLQTL